MWGKRKERNKRGGERADIFSYSMGISMDCQHIMVTCMYDYKMLVINIGWIENASGGILNRKKSWNPYIFPENFILDN